jgi:hypothetical protein
MFRLRRCDACGTREWVRNGEKSHLKFETLLSELGAKWSGT